MVTLEVKIVQFPEPAGDHNDELVAEQGDFNMVRDITALLPSEYIGTLIPSLTFELQLGFLRDGRLRIREPLKVTVTSEDRQVVAEAEEVNEYGYGQNRTDAITDLQRAVAELYLTLEEDQDRLGPGLQVVWKTLQAKIQRR